jgi:predicted O-methyltransferase YrrM
MQRSNSNIEIQNLNIERKLLYTLRKEAALKKIPIIDINAGRFLELICVLENPVNILEIGCGTGFSSYFLIKNLGRGRYTGIDLNRERISRAEEFIGSLFPEKKASFLSGNALKIIPELKDRFDLVFIDGAKFEYLQYIKVLDNKLIPGALIIADNIFYSNKIFKDKIRKHDLNSVNGIREYINYIKTSSKFENYLFDVSDGLSVTKFIK